MGRRKHFRRRFLNKNKNKNKEEKKDEQEESIDLLNKTTSLTYQQSLRMVEITHENKQYLLNMSEELEICALDDDDDDGDADNQFNLKSKQVQLPDVNIKTIEDDSYPWWKHDPKLPTSYRKYREKTFDEIDEELEYDIDEEDIEWLKLINKDRVKNDLKEISKEQFIYIMDRLEKESYFQLDTKQPAKEDSEEDDAICCICLDGECLNSNVILFCDMCNLAVHQECYGVPYIPEGQWLCRKCIQSPSNAVSCILCPNQYGAFKQTDDNRWAHMICAIWIPEVHFANTVFLEPIIGIENIESARWKLMCYICRKRNQGACIQCDKANCYTAFHVTCAQQAGLYMNIQDPTVDTSNDVKKLAYCDIHTPADGNKVNDETLKREQAKRIKKVRKILAERQPIILMPKLSQKTKTNLLQKIKGDNKQKILQLCINYWLLKRKLRSGVPLIRRLQTSVGLKHGGTGGGFTKLHKEKIHFDEKFKSEYKEQIRLRKRLRQDLERARLLMELIRKRERTKRELVKTLEAATIYQLKPFQMLLTNILDKLRDFDRAKVFHEPVKDVAGYYELIKEPMDFSTMQTNVEKNKYSNFKEFEHDFNLIVSNCLTFNKNTPYYSKLGIKLRDYGKSIFSEAKENYTRDFEQDGSGVHTDYLRHITTNTEEDDCCMWQQQHEKSDDDSYISDDVEVNLLSDIIKTERRRTISYTSIKQEEADNDEVTKINEMNKKKNKRRIEEKNLSINSSSSLVELANINNKTKTEEENLIAEIEEINNNNRTSSSVVVDKRKNKRKRKPVMPMYQSENNSDVPIVADCENGSSDEVVVSEKKCSPKKMVKKEKKSKPETTPSTTLGIASSEVYLLMESDEEESFTDTEESDAEADVAVSSSITGSSVFSKTFLEPLNLVWAKLPSYPWWPGVIINPSSVRSDLQIIKMNNKSQNLPSNELLKQKDAVAGTTKSDYLVYLFERKNPWYWIANTKLKQFGVDNDKTYTNFKKAPKYKKDLQVAYKAALNVYNLLNKNNNEKIEFLKTPSEEVATTPPAKSTTNSRRKKSSNSNVNNTNSEFDC